MKFSNLFKVGALLWGMSCAIAVFATPVEVSKPQEAIPPNIVTTANKPMVMLAASKDHTLFGPIYTDFEDLDGDGYLDTTYLPTFKYYGYFDSETCYSYSTTNSRFAPVAEATKVAVTVGSITKYKYTCSGRWSGNFLNWATMTRMDVIRKMMYGGKRSTDTTSATILERADLGHDSHAFVKHYRGTDIADYTPFSVASLKKTTGSNVGEYAGLSICNRSDTDGLGGNPLMLIAKGNYKLWATVEGLACQWGPGSGAATAYGGQSLGPKLAAFYEDADKGRGGIAHEVNRPSKAADGALAGGSELVVRNEICVSGFKEADNCQKYANTAAKPFGIFQEFGLPSNGASAARTEFGMIGGSYDKNLTAGALRRNMGDMRDEINLTTGVFCHSAGAACPATLADTRTTNANVTTGAGAIKTFDNINIYGTGAGNYAGDSTKRASGLVDGDFPAWGNPMGEMLVQAIEYYAGRPSTNPTTTTNDGTGRPVITWRDPLAETGAINESRTAIYGKPICRPMNLLALSSSALSFDQDADTGFSNFPNRSGGSLADYTNKIGDAESITGTLRSVAAASGTLAAYEATSDGCSAKTVGQLANVIGICPDAPATGGTYKVAGAALYANTSEIRARPATVPSDLPPTALKIKTLAASLSGGVARVEVPIPVKGDVTKLTAKKVYITPEGLGVPSDSNPKIRLPMSVLTFDAIAASPPGELPWGTFVVTWNNRLFGGDYDMDITGFLRYDVVVNNATASGYDVKITTDILNVGMGSMGAYGYSVIGSTTDGRRLTHRHRGAGDAPMLAPSVAAGYMCGDAAYLAANDSNNGGACNVSCGGNDVFWTGSGASATCNKAGDFRKTFTYQMVGVDNVTLNDPLWYAGKYGSFTSAVKNSDGTVTNYPLPPNVSSWDSLKEDGSLGSDGVPDGYFLARRPDILAAQLRKALDAVTKNSNAAPATSSSQLTLDGYKYVVKFDSTKVTGTVEAFKVNAEGNFENTPNWEAGALLDAAAGSNAGNNRKIITNSDNGASAGVPFRWASLPASYKTEMTTASTNVLSATNAQIALNYIRGDKTLEGLNGLRQRDGSLLGPIVNGTPVLQSVPDATLPGMAADGYGTFLRTHKSRNKLLWVAANDGMLHAFNPESGQEVFAYVPGALANRLAEIPLQRGTTARTKISDVNFVTGSEVQPTGTVWPYVDGSPFYGDVKIGSTWKTYVFGTLGRGGRGVFALDATEIADLTESNAANVFKWQFTSDNDADLGYITGKISKHSASNQALPIVKLNNGKYALLLGNGHKSTAGKAALFILYMEGPNGSNWSGRYIKIVADAGTGNGLSAPRWEDIDGNGTADVAYAGDLKGNLWKFNLASSNPAAWDVAFKTSGVNAPLYKATYTNANNQVIPLPITTAPEMLYMGKGGLMVTFATGNAFENGDFPGTGVVHRVYGIWDRPGMGVSGGRALPTGLTTLVSRTYTRNADGVVTLNSGSVVDWDTHDGWYFNLPGSSEAVLLNPELKAGVMLFTAARPKSGVNECSAEPDSSLYGVDPISGRPERNIQGTITINSEKVIVAAREVDDQPISVVSDRTKKPFTKSCNAGEAGCTCVGSTCTKESPICGSGQRAFRALGRTTDVVLCTSTSPRLQWREVPGLRTNQ